MVFSEYIKSMTIGEYKETTKKLREECRVDQATVWRWVWRGDMPSTLYRKEIARVLERDELELFPDETRTD